MPTTRKLRWLYRLTCIGCGLACVFVVYPVPGNISICGFPLPHYVVEDGLFFVSPLSILSLPADFAIGFFACRLAQRAFSRWLPRSVTQVGMPDNRKK